MTEKQFVSKCPRCGERNGLESEFCMHCGISLAFNRPAILKDNRWEAAADELAVFFMSRDLKGLFSKPLRVPPGMRAWILQDNRVEDLQEGEYAIETPLDRINTFFNGKHAEIIISRMDAMPVKFVFNDILSAELLPVTVETTLYVLVGDPAAFRNHFMLRPGALSSAQLHEMLTDSVRQIVAEILGAKRLEEMAALTGLRQDLDRALMRGLQHRFKGFGLAFDQADTLFIRHDRLDESRSLVGSYWIEYDKARLDAEHQKSMNELYTQEEQEGIKAKEEKLRRRYRDAELSQEEAELVRVIRLRELENYEKMTEAETRQKAINLKAREQVEWMEQQYGIRRRQREQGVLKEAWREEDGRSEWLHLQNIAKIRYEAEKRAAEVEKNESEAIARQGIANILEKIRIEGKIEHSRMIEDEEDRKKRLAVEMELLLKDNLLEQALREARHQVAVDEIKFAAEISQRVETRIQALEDKLLEEKLAEIEVRVSGAKTASQQTDMVELIKINEANEFSRIRVALSRKRQEQEVEDERADKALDRELLMQQKQREAERVKRADDIQHAQLLGTLPPEAVIALCNPENLKGLVDYLKTKITGVRDAAPSLAENFVKDAYTDLIAILMNTFKESHSILLQGMELRRKNPDSAPPVWGEFSEVQVQAMTEQLLGGLRQSTSAGGSADDSCHNEGDQPLAKSGPRSFQSDAGFSSANIKRCARCQNYVAMKYPRCPVCDRAMT